MQPEKPDVRLSINGISVYFYPTEIRGKKGRAKESERGGGHMGGQDYGEIGNPGSNSGIEFGDIAGCRGNLGCPRSAVLNSESLTLATEGGWRSGNSPLPGCGVPLSCPSFPSLQLCAQPWPFDRLRELKSYLR
jgi:hypothetical protein